MTTPARPAPGQPAPELTGPAIGPLAPEGRFSLADRLKDGKGAIVYFYPAAMTPGCTTQACDFRDNLEAFIGLGYDVVGVSPDPIEKLEKFAGKESLPFTLVSDEDHAIAAAWGAWGEKKNYGKVHEGLIRSTVVVRPDGTVERALHNVKATGHVARLLRLLGEG